MASPASASHDKPAIVLSSILGVAAILGTVFFLPRFYCENPSATCTTSGPGGGPLAFDVTWGKMVGEAKTQAFTGSGNLQVHFIGVQAGAVVTIGACTDSAVTPVQSQATITYTISDGRNVTQPKAFTCSSFASGGSELTLPAPDVATVSGNDQASAAKNLDLNSKVRSREVTYTITITVARAASAVPSVVGAQNPNLSVSFTAQAMKYTPTLTPHKSEVSK